MKGKIEEKGFAEIFSLILKSDYRHSSLLTVAGGTALKTRIDHKEIRFILSDSPADSFLQYLGETRSVGEKQAAQAAGLAKKEGIRLGKAMTRMGLVGYQEMWELVKDHQRSLFQKLCVTETGEYSIQEEPEESGESITIDIPLTEAILALMRTNPPRERISDKFELAEKVYIKERHPRYPAAILPHEIHIHRLCTRYRSIDEIVSHSELSEDDTLRYLYYYYLIDSIATEKGEKPAKKYPEPAFGIISFNSYEEALTHYNIKFEMIFKILSKEIGPVALSIMSNSIDDIRDNLPVFLRHTQLDRGGRLMEKKILKKVWYHDYEHHSSEFVRGLEELLYAQIYAVRKNLGVDYENQILKWLKGTGNRNG